MSKGKRANQLWNGVAVPRCACETKGKLKHCLRVASFSPHSSISRLATMSLYESCSRIRHTSLQWYVFLWTTLASCVLVPTGTNHNWISGRNAWIHLFSLEGDVVAKQVLDVDFCCWVMWFWLDEFYRCKDKWRRQSAIKDHQYLY